jgi:hypothetical protein
VTLPDGTQVNLRDWLHSLRRGGTDLRWARPVLEALGMTGLRPAGAGDPAVAGPARQPGAAPPRPVPVFRRATVALDQARSREVVRIEGAGPLGDEELMITEWRLVTQDRLAPRRESDQEFPWRDPADPLNRVYAPYAGADGRLHPQVTVRGARMGPVQRMVRQRLAVEPQQPRLAGAGQDWQAVRQSLEREVADRVRATIGGRAVPDWILPRLLTAEDLPAHEREHLVGNYGAFLTGEALAQRPLLLGLYPGPVLDEPGAEERWQAGHQAYPTYAVGIQRRSGRESLMSAEGYAGAVAFANTRLIEGADPPAIDRSPTGVNALLVPFEVQLTLPPGPGRPGRTRWQPLVALIALDNLYAGHNPGGMVIADYGDSYLPLLRPPSPPVKSEPGTPPA